MSIDQAPAEIAPQGRSRALEQTLCEQCGKPLTGRQVRFCSRLCNSTWWDAKHPRLGRPPAAPDGHGIPLRDRVLGLMLDGAWYTDLELAERLGILQSTAGASRRDLEKAKYGAFKFEKRTAARAYSRRAWEYRLVKP
jgi:hypothetical protein